MVRFDTVLAPARFVAMEQPAPAAPFLHFDPTFVVQAPTIHPQAAFPSPLTSLGNNNSPSTSPAARSQSSSGSGSPVELAVAPSTPPGEVLEEDCNLFILQLAPSVTERQLAATFGAIGPIASLKLMVHLDTGVSRGFAFVMYQRIEDARTAVATLHGSVLGGQPMSVRYVDRRLLRHPVILGSPTKKIFVRNLPIDVTEADLRSVLRFATALDITLSPDRSSGRVQNMAHIVFATVEQAQEAAAALHGTTPFRSCEAPILTKVIDSNSKNRRRVAHKQQADAAAAALPAAPMVAAMPPLAPYWPTPFATNNNYAG